jgi:Na+/H+ antiporter NhaD/arsenite permease-like protein
MVTLCVKLVSDQKERFMFIGMIIIAANAGGAWSPIGDVTTTMLWIGGQVTLQAIVTRLFFPSLVNLLVPLVLATLMMRVSKTDNSDTSDRQKVNVPRRDQIAVFCCGLAALLFVPAFKTVTHLPPFMGMMLSLGSLWIVTQIIHWNKPREEREQLSVGRALERMDVPSVLFFLGILLAVGALKFAGMLSAAAETLTATFSNEKIILACIGVLSAIVDNVPVVAAAMAMYPIDVYPVDHGFWVLLAYCAGTGGSLLIIGSAAGVAAMGIEKISFGWYLKHIAWLALTGYLAGLGAYLLQEYLIPA